MISSHLTLKQLEALVCVVDMGSFRKAAAVLGTTQPNISNRISKLEADLGGILMHRDAGAVRLTERGKTLVAAARQVLWSAEAFLEVAARQDLIADRMRLGVTELIACSWLHPFLRRFREAYPSVSVELEVGLSTEISKKLASGEIDLALQPEPFAIASSGSIPLETCRYVWVAAPDHVREWGEQNGLAEILRSPVLTHARHTLASDGLVKRAASRKLPLDQIVYSSSLASCVQMAVDGMGAALLPAVLVRDQLDAGSLVEIGSDWYPEPLKFFARFDKAKAPRFVAMAAELAVDVAKARR
ncbi:LysR family transcriptional regulator [Paracoccus seriniphilus]|uniref:DNA-binding transcriptional regulator, LysR family n=1 Tax=Paracoccus seriniphilus TaxID=184748 RepID=A0A239PUC8_9RHOB|nr:LysR family transcriptional regulator [Paracoccus seriniphilus]WCR15380.1 LysR family transcriptional regulator [Paracoccus seriniphilus]SNT73865.1 DNA-binding transcriptional regulator, LysR family [Paracoccus seriniphilus]